MANETKLNMTLLLRRAAFDDSCVLKEGEPGYHTEDKVFKVGDGTTSWGNLPIANSTQIQAMIDATASKDFENYYTKTEVDNIRTALEGAINGVDGELAAEVTARTQADTQIRTDFAAADTTTLNTAKDYADTKKSEVIGASGDVSTANTVYGAKKHAEEKAAAAQAAAESTAANDATAKANAAESAAKAHAETKASDAQAAAIAAAESKDAARATAAAEALAGAKSELEGKITSGDATTLESAKDYTDEKVSAEATARTNADNALGGRLDTVEAKLANVSNVMDFVGARTVTVSEQGVISVTADEGDSFSKGDVVVATSGDHAGKEFVFDGATWHEFGYADSNTASINDLKERMDAAEGDIDQAQADIIALGTNKLDKSTYETYISGKAMSDADLKKYAEDEANAAQSAAEAKAAELDTVLHTTISAEIDADIKTAIDAEVTRSNAYADKAESDAIATAASQADAKDAALKTAIEGTSSDASSDKTIAGAKKYADEKAEAARASAVSTAAGDATSKANTAKSEAISAAATDATTKANTAKSEAIAAVVGTANDDANTDTIKGVRKAIDSGDAATLTSAKAYADEKVAGAVTKVTAGNDDIVVTPAGGTGNVTVAHKTYATGTYTKDPESSDKTGDIYFFDSIATTNGHVTGGTMKSLASILESMTFIFDGGTSAN